MAGYDIAEPHQGWVRLNTDLELIHDIMGGTGAMRAAGLRWLPREEAESWPAWQHRLNRSVLFNGLTRCVNAMCGHIICGDVTLSNSTAGFDDIINDIDRSGTSLTHFAMKLVYLMLRDGQAHIWVDAPRDGGRPYATLFEANQMIGQRHDADGKVRQVRFRTSYHHPKGQYGMGEGRQVNLYQQHDDGPVEFARWQQPHQNEVWQEAQKGHLDIAQMPLVTAHVGVAHGGYARPPLMDLAWLNLAHWQSASDQRHILHVARVPILFAKGIVDSGAPLDIGPNRVIIADDPQADMKFIEHSGAAIEAGRQDLIDLEDKMMMMGLDMMAARRPHPTATSQIIEQTHHKAMLGQVTEAAKDALQRMMMLMALWQDQSPRDVGKITMPVPNPAMMKQHHDTAVLLAARQAGDLSKDEFLSEIERRGIMQST